MLHPFLPCRHPSYSFSSGQKNRAYFLFASPPHPENRQKIPVMRSMRPRSTTTVHRSLREVPTHPSRPRLRYISTFIFVREARSTFAHSLGRLVFPFPILPYSLALFDNTGVPGASLLPLPHSIPRSRVPVPSFHNVIICAARRPLCSRKTTSRHDVRTRHSHSECSNAQRVGGNPALTPHIAVSVIISVAS